MKNSWWEKSRIEVSSKLSQIIIKSFSSKWIKKMTISFVKWISVFEESKIFSYEKFVLKVEEEKE